MEKMIDRVVRSLPMEVKRPSNSMVLAWVGFFSFSFLVYYLLSDGDFSFILTYSAICRCFAFFLLNFRMFTSNSGSSVSLKTLQAYVVVFAFRLLSLLRHEGYLPYDRSGDWFYHLVETSSLAMACAAIYLLYFRFRATYDESKDSFGNLHIPSHFGVVYIIVPALFMAVIFHPNLNKDFVSDASWTFSMYLESVAILPQLYMFQKQANLPLEVLVSHCVFALGFARVIEMAFWLWSFHELTGHTGGRLVGYVVLLSQFIHVVFMGDFFYYYFQSIHRGTPMQLLPSHSGLV